MHACTSRKGLKLSWFVVLAAKNDFIHKISTLDQQEEAQPEVTSCLLLSALTFSFFFSVKHHFQTVELGSADQI